MARRGLGAGVITLIVVDAVLIVVLIALLITHPSDPAETGEAPAEPAGASPGLTPAETEVAETQEPGTPEEDLEAALQPPADALSETVFATPSRNIWCQIETRVTCTIGYHTYAPPEPGTECAGTLGRVAQLTEDEATMPCITGSVASSAPAHAPDLDYGQSTVAHGFWCTSQESGLTCASVQTGAGFTLAVAEFDTF